MNKTNIIEDQITLENKCLEELKFMIKGDEVLEKLRSSILDDRFLLHFVRGRKCHCTSAFSTLQNYISLRKDRYKEMFQSISPRNLPVGEHLVKKLKYQDKDEVVTGVFRTSEWHTDEVSIEVVLKLGILSMETIWYDETVERNGLNLIMDLNGYSLKHMRECNPLNIRKALAVIINGFPVRVHRVHFINAPHCFFAGYKLVKHFLPRKLKSRLHVSRNDLSTLHLHYPTEVLPDWLGGKLEGDEAFDLDFIQKVQSRDEYCRIFNEKLDKS